MTIDAVDSSDALEDWLNSQEASSLQKILEEKVLKFLLSNDPTAPHFQYTLEQLARFGTHPLNLTLLEKEIEELHLPVITECGLGKKTWRTTCKVAHFFKQHKTEILVGAALCATGIGLAAITGYTLSGAVGGIVVAGARSIFTPEEKPNPHIPNVAPPSSKSEIALFQQPLHPFPTLDLPPTLDEIWVTSNGIWANGIFYSSHELMQQSTIKEELCSYPTSYLPPSWTTPHLAHQDPFPNPIASNPIADTKIPGAGLISTKFTIPGKEKPSIHIGWINGIYNTLEESKASAKYLQSLSNGLTIAGIHNCTHTPLIDLLECTLLNYSGHSPFTSKMLLEEWTTFHKANASQPNAKLLQFCHSQGAIHVRNALEQAPPEIQNRVIVTAIAPAVVVSKRLCFKSFNYVSEKDVIYKFEPNSTPVTSLSLDDVLVPTFGESTGNKNELIVLKAHPNPSFLDHEVNSPTYRSSIEKILANYKQHEGEYLPEEKGELE